MDDIPPGKVLRHRLHACDIGVAPSPDYSAIEQLVAAKVLIPLSESKRNRAWEAAGLLDLVTRLEGGELPA